MKNLILVVLASFIFTGLNAQSCADGWLPFTKGIKYEHTNYNKKGKVESVTNGEILSVTDGDEGTVALVNASTVDGKGKNAMNDLEIRYICNDGVYEVDLNDTFKQMTAQLPAEVDIRMDGIRAKYPNVLTAGDKLPDGEANFSASMMGMTMMSGEVKMVNRAVVGTEKVTTPAGTFDTVKITYDLQSKTMGMSKNYAVTQWLARGVGMVKQETYEKEKLSSSTELTKFSK